MGEADAAVVAHGGECVGHPVEEEGGQVVDCALVHEAV